MPDYSACTNTTCPSRQDCARYRMSDWGMRQSVGAFAPDESGKCTHFWDVDKGAPFRLHSRGFEHKRNVFEDIETDSQSGEQ